MNTFKNILLLLAVLFICLAPMPAQAQITMTTTTLAVAATATGSPVTVAASTSVEAGGYLYVDRELMQVASTYVAGSTTVPVLRGVSGTRAAGHPTTSTVYVAKPGQQARLGFRTYDLSGTCTATSEYILPVVNVLTGQVVNCDGSPGKWIVINGPATLGTGLTALGPNAVNTVDIGSAALPFRKWYAGTAATNNFVFTPAATAAARVITIADPLIAANMALVKRGTITFTAAQVNTATCSAAQESAVAGLTTASSVVASLNAAPDAETAKGLTFYAYPEAGKVVIKVCNPTGGNLTPAADLVFNYAAIVP